MCETTEELAYACAACASYLMLPVFFNRFLLRYGSPTLADQVRVEVTRGHVVTAFAASERRAGSDLGALEVGAARTSDGYRLNGRKEYSTNARLASRIIVVAKGPRGGGSADGLTWLAVPAEAGGVHLGRRWETFGLRALDVSPVEFTDVEVPTSSRLGEEGAGLSLLNRNLAQSRTGIAALAVGVARRARDLVFDFAKQRRIYGDRLLKMQAYRFKLVDIELDIAAARSLVFASADKFDAGIDHGKEASMAKLYAGQMVIRVTTAAMTMLGSVGYTGQSLVEKLLRDGGHVPIVEGPEPIHREIIFAEMLRRGGA
jgi:alkylation response protein AidB-like acyl-CoA dehydrogenase